MSGLVIRIVHHDQLNEAMQADCSHGSTTQTSTTDTASALALVHDLLLVKHRSEVGCGCMPVGYEDFWPSWTVARDLYVEDEANGTMVGRPASEVVLHRLITKQLVEGGCQSCAASALIRLDRTEPVRLTLVHTDDCPREHIPERRVWA